MKQALHGHVFVCSRKFLCKNFKNTKDDVDVNILHINKFVKDAMQGVPGNIEVFFVNQEDYLKVTPLGQILIDNRHLFLSQQLQKKYAGYAQSQFQKMKKSQSFGIGRQDLVENFGYDTKFFMHTIRLLTSGIEIAETCDHSTYRPNLELLLRCRKGDFTFDEAIEMVEMYDNQLKISFGKTALPLNADYDKINKLLMDINREALGLTF